MKDNPALFDILRWGKLGSEILEDLSRALLGFVFNGLDRIYQYALKPLPFIGNFFSRRAVEQVFKLISGITIGQGLAHDVAHVVMRPIGSLLGGAFGLLVGRYIEPIPAYQNQIGKLLYRLSGQTIGGALFGALMMLDARQFGWVAEISALQAYALAISIGGLLGMLAKSMLLLAMKTVNNANAAAIRKTVQRAKELNEKLKNAAKQKAKSRVLMHAQDIIQQMNGSQSQQHLEKFFRARYDIIAASMTKKIERHFNYLTDRASHGDVEAFNRLRELIPQKATAGEKTAFDIMLERIFNQRAIFKLKDDVDTAFDRWQYQFLRAKATNS